MLLRSASTPVLNSLIHVSSQRESPIEAESVHQIQRHRFVMLSTSSSCCYSPMSVHSSDDSPRRMKRTASDSDLRHLSSAKPANKFLSGALVEDMEEGFGFGLLRTSSKDDELEFNWGLEDDCEVYGGGRGRSGGRSDGSHGDGGNDSNMNNSTDDHYRKMIEENPGNGLFLSNYAKYLKEVRKDYVNAEEYCGRAILVNPNDGNVLSMYAELIWQIHKDSSRAETYFNQAVAAAPDDSYVIASYARFLWESEEEDEDEEEQEERREELEPQVSRMNLFTERSSISAVS